MMYSRYLWNDVLQCHAAGLDVVALMLVSSFLALLPITFYIASHINSSDVTNNLLRREFSLTSIHHRLFQIISSDICIFSVRKYTCDSAIFDEATLTWHRSSGPVIIHINYILRETKNPWSTSFPLIVWVCLHRNFCAGLWETHVM